MKLEVEKYHMHVIRERHIAEWPSAPTDTAPTPAPPPAHEALMDPGLHSHVPSNQPAQSGSESRTLAADGEFSYGGTLCSRQLPQPLGSTALRRGTVLVAAADRTGRYAEAVVLLCEHSDLGSFGLMLNKPLTEDRKVNLHRALLSDQAMLLSGGPAHDREVSLMHIGTADDGGSEIVDGLVLNGADKHVQQLHEELDFERSPTDPKLMIFFGYTGWPPQELERQFRNGLWNPCAGSVEHLTAVAADELYGWLIHNCHTPSVTDTGGDAVPEIQRAVSALNVNALHVNTATA